MCYNEASGGCGAEMQTYTSALEHVKKKIVSVLQENSDGLRAREIAEKVGYGRVDLTFRGILMDLLIEKRICSRLVNKGVKVGHPLFVDNYYI